MSILNKGIQVVKGLFNKNKMDIDLDKTVETAGEVIQSSSYKEQGTRRLNIDMLSDSWLSKNIRPIIVVWALTMLTFIIISRVCGLVVNSEDSNTVHTITIIAVTFYFPLRSAEKLLKSKIKNKDRKSVV